MTKNHNENDGATTRAPDAEVLDKVIEVEDHRVSTVWTNPTNADIILDLYVGVIHGRPPRNREEKTGQRTYRIRAGESRAIPSEFDGAIQDTECQEPQCAGRGKRLCRNPEHRRHLVAGLGTRLVKKGTQPLKIAPALFDRPETLTKPPTSTTPTRDLSAEELIMQRAAARRAGVEMNTTAVKPTKQATKGTVDAIAAAREAVDLTAIDTATKQGELAEAQRHEADARSAAAGDKTKSRAFIDSQAETTLARDRLATAEAKEGEARARLAALVTARQEEDHAAGIVRSLTWVDRLQPALARLDAIDLERASVVDMIADAVVQAQVDFDETNALEMVLRPHVGLRERGVDRASLQTGFYLARVFLAHARSAGKRDAFPDELTAEPIPKWDDPARPMFEQAAKMLGIKAPEGEKQ